MAEYIPGVCNIGTQEIKKRRQVGFIGTTIAVIFFLFLFVLHANHTWRLLTWIPIFFAGAGFLQARSHFCSGYGMRGEYNVTQQVGNTQKIKDTESRKKDRQKAYQILYIAALIAIIITTVLFFV